MIHTPESYDVRRLDNMMELEEEYNAMREEQREEIDSILPDSDWAVFALLLGIIASWGAIIWGIVQLAHRFFGL